ncbi:glycoside hydrolase family 92 protein [Sanghuangporus baumii]|uniref:Glycoside hydrolase family 92 protein n=1 Tax=Sanghuangporus baumii TaxID=108892 RepID=A0A9Q5HT88_SANBA|nr:glycoside hydrolase family 92 protein [Sanghuangporus baumii]
MFLEVVADEPTQPRYCFRMIGNGGITPDGSGGMIPSVAPPFGMTRWVAQTRSNYVSVTPYNHTDREIHGFQATHQPAIWMGESATFTVVPGTGEVKPRFEDRAMKFEKKDEQAGAVYYKVQMTDEKGGEVKTEMTATSRVGHLRFTFPKNSDPFVLLEVTRASVMGYDSPTNFTYPVGSVHIDPVAREISGNNPERQDFLIGPNPAPSFSGYFVARFDVPFVSWGVARNGSISANEIDSTGAQLSGYVRFADASSAVNVRVGVSFISVDQARRNLENEVPDGLSLEETAYETRKAWKDKLETIAIEGATKENLTTFYTGFFHALQYPYEQSEEGKYYSGYDDTVHDSDSYTGYSIWDTFRAAWAWQILFVPERIPAMVTSMLQDYKETNIMVGTHADSLVAEAVLKGFGDKFDAELAYEAGVGYEVRAGLSTVYAPKGWVANDIHSEAASRTLDYAYDDYAVAVLAAALNKTADAESFGTRSHSAYKSIFNNGTGFMEARNASGAWAGQDQGWTEGDMWAYTFDVPHDVPGLVALKGGNASFVDFLDQHFDGGHNAHTNEATSKTQQRVRDIAREDYNDTIDGLSGNEDCGQMSAWYLFRAYVPFFPYTLDDPVMFLSAFFRPFFDKVTINLPGAPRPLVITSKGAPTKKYVKSLTIDGIPLVDPVITHAQIAHGANIVFEMSDRPQAWGSATIARGEDAAREGREHTERAQKAEL